MLKGDEPLRMISLPSGDEQFHAMRGFFYVAYDSKMVAFPSLGCIQFRCGCLFQAFEKTTPRSGPWPGPVKWLL